MAMIGRQRRGGVKTQGCAVSKSAQAGGLRTPTSRIDGEVGWAPS
jgi:hypothetical protein